MRYREFLLEYSREKTLANDGLMTKVMAAVKRKDPTIIGRIDRGIDVQFDDPENREYVLDKFERMDPTPNKQYMQPIMNMYVKDKFRGFEDQNRLKDALTLFARFKQRLDNRDINQYASLHDLEDAVEPHAQELTKKEKRQQGEYHIDENSYELWKESASYVVVIPKDQKAACAFGAGTKWCTASKDNDYFTQYDDEGTLFIIRKKDINYEKDSIIATTTPLMQWHFETAQFMDVTDRPVDLFGRWSKSKKPIVDQELYDMFGERFKNQLYLWLSHYMTEKSKAYDAADFENEFPVYNLIFLMNKYNKQDTAEALDGTLKDIAFVEFYEYYKQFKDFSMFSMVRAMTEEFISALSKFDNGVYDYLRMRSTERHDWWKTLAARIRQGNEYGKLAKIMTHSKYDWELGKEANDANVDFTKYDAWYYRLKFVSSEINLFYNLLQHAPEYADKKFPLFRDGNQVEKFKQEIRRTKNFLQSAIHESLQNWMNGYVIPLILEKDGLSEQEIKSWYEDGGPPEGPHVNATTIRLLNKRTRDETMQSHNWKETVEGLI
tara:strand:+ start:1987 stop:3636 length:1650 start_codon:yes stop_codon:yes gene_type:complete